jgi:O-antigen/teichoic acid export membrane protein
VTDRSASRALLGRGSIYTLATAAQLTGALLVQPVLTRVMPKAEYGVAALGIIITATLGLLITLGLPAVITREHFRDADGGKGTGPLVTLSVGLAVLLGAVAFATGPLWAEPLGGFTAPLMLATATSVSYAVIIACQAVQRARNEAGRFVLVVAINILGGQLAGLAAVYLIDRTATIYLFGVALGSVVGAALALFWARPSLPGLRDRAALRAWFAIALPTVPHLAALYLMTAGDRYIVQALQGDEATAEYNVAYLTGALGITLVAAANNAWAPLIYGTPDERRWQVLAVTTQDMLRVAGIAAVGLAMTAPLALAIIAPAGRYDVADLTPVVAITALATVPYVLYLASAHVLFWTGRTTALIWITPLAVGVNLVAKALVLPEFGFVGAAAVTVAAYALLALLIGLVRRGLAVVPWRRRWPEVVGAAALCVVGAVLPANAVGYAVRAVLTVALIGLLALTARQLLADRRSARAGRQALPSDVVAAETAAAETGTMPIPPHLGSAGRGATAVAEETAGQKP